MKKYSIIIPTLNEAETIHDFLIPLQVLRDLCEIIIVDAGSMDETKSISQSLVDRFIITPKGRAIQMNAGAEIAAANIFIFLHADTYLPEQALSLIQQGMDKGALWGRFDMQLMGQHTVLKVVSHMMNWRSRLSGIATGDQVIFITRQAFEQVGGFPVIALMEDIEISKRLKNLSYPYCIKAKVKSSARRWESFGVWRTVALMWSIRLRYFLGQSPNELVELYRQGAFWRRL
ncbi:MAG: glycosyltransferase [Methyloprofundus sp.]|nr:glycosyltransferase [Methyloprofundus sp.]